MLLFNKYLEYKEEEKDTKHHLFDEIDQIDFEESQEGKPS
jgi:hypothetical protein